MAYWAFSHLSNCTQLTPLLHSNKCVPMVYPNPFKCGSNMSESLKTWQSYNNYGVVHISIRWVHISPEGGTYQPKVISTGWYISVYCGCISAQRAVHISPRSVHIGGGTYQPWYISAHYPNPPLTIWLHQWLKIKIKDKDKSFIFRWMQYTKKNC